MLFLLIIVMVLITVSTTESVSWSFTMVHHAKWLNAHPDYERRMAVAPVILTKVAVFSFGLSIISWGWFMHLMALLMLGSLVVTYKAFICFTLIFGIQVITISLWSIISKFICLPGVFWPLLSRIRIKCRLSMFDSSDTDSYIEALKEWRKINIEAKQGKSLIVNFLNNLPVIVWTKSINRKYTFMSGYFYSRFNLDPHVDLIGKTGKEVAEIVIKADPSFEGTTFDEDELRLFEKQKQLTAFVEVTVQNKPVSFQIVNVPMYKKGKLTGLIGIARETTWEVEQMTKIHNLFLANRTTEGILEFEKFLSETKEYKYIEKGMAVLRGDNQ